MRTLFSAALIGASLMAAPVMAWTSEPTQQPASNGMLVYGYNTTNYCPAGLQPVVVGGVVCCGTPNTTNYRSHPAPVRRKVHKPVQRTYVAHGKGFDEGVVVYEKGQ